MNWNKGNSLAKNKMASIEQLIEQYTPDILCIHELNIRQDEDLNLFQITGYVLITDSMLEEYGLSRTGIFIKQELRYKRRTDLEVIGDSNIWITVFPHRQKCFNLCSYYRQWQIVTNKGRINNTDSITSQKTRLQKYTLNVQISINESETICCQDTNVDLSKGWDDPQNLDHNDKNLIPVYKIFKNEMLDKGMVFIKTGTYQNLPRSPQHIY